eukprot:TRINITY_DN6111_c0_g1_i1.p3 TRINITY_DN6111_c0_g1~~TRINITY_DN6111_c0_g1_i1.p3  ORF type:complete len:187 (+),score=39.48 TRINITY_DN6111_c0_g1_i1:291-851(+)
MLLGSAKGITGLFTKPLSGLLDATSKAAEGIKNSAISKDDRPNDKRSRPIRPFYTHIAYFRDYAFNDAQAVNFLQTKKAAKFANHIFIDSYLFMIKKQNQSEFEEITLILTNLALIYCNLQKMTYQYKIKFTNIRYFEMVSNGVKMEFVMPLKKIKGKEYIIEINDQEIKTQLFNQIKEIKNIYWQ